MFQDSLHPKCPSFSRLCPIFQVSNVEGTNLHLLTMFLNLLSTPRTSLDDKEPPHFQIDDTYQVPVSCSANTDFKSISLLP